jgi:hypothetical protein
MIAFAIMAGGLSMHASADDNNGWFWGRGMMGHMFRSEMMGRGMMGGWGPGMMMGGRFSSERLDALKTELKITEQQQKAWDGYTSTITDALKTMRDAHAQLLQGPVPKTLPERVNQHQAMMSVGFETMKKVDAATLTLYDALDAGQKKKADDLILGMGMM